MTESKIYFVNGDTEVVDGSLGDVQSKLQESAPFVVLSHGEDQVIVNPKHVVRVRVNHEPFVGVA